MDKVTVTTADVDRKIRWQQRFMTEGIGESELLDEEFAAHRIEATRQAEEQIKLLREALEAAVGLLWEHCEGIAPRIEPLEEALEATNG